GRADLRGEAYGHLPVRAPGAACRARRIGECPDDSRDLRSRARRAGAPSAPRDRQVIRRNAPPMSRHFGIRRIGTILFIATAALFLGAAIIRQGEQLRVFEWQIAPARLALSTLALTGAFALGVSIWGMVL